MPKSASGLTRRRFIAGSAAFAASAVVPRALHAQAPQTAGEFRSRWDACPDRLWLGPEYWANPLQDWQTANGRIECTHAAPDRNVHVLTRQLGERVGTLDMRVRLGRLGNAPAPAESAGFRIGAQGPLAEYRNNLIFG